MERISVTTMKRTITATRKAPDRPAREQSATRIHPVVIYPFRQPADYSDLWPLRTGGPAGRGPGALRPPDHGAGPQDPLRDGGEPGFLEFRSRPSPSIRTCWMPGAWTPARCGTPGWGGLRARRPGRCLLADPRRLQLRHAGRAGGPGPAARSAGDHAELEQDLCIGEIAPTTTIPSN